MVSIRHCGRDTRAKTYRLPSDKPAYVYQHLMHVARCRKCGKELMVWRGEYPCGERYTGLVEVRESEFPNWRRRILAGEAKPEAQLVSDWSQMAARPADVAIFYHRRVAAAQRRTAL